MSKPSKIIDSHLHIWATESESKSSYPYASSTPTHTPPQSLIDSASPSALITQMKDANVNGCLIVQPINHLFNHDYVLDAMKTHPTLFKGMLLHDPSLKGDIALGRLEELVLKGFVGVRFNPYLWPLENNGKDENISNENKKYMSKGSGLQIYKRCGELGIPVGIMCFKGLGLHYDDIVDLLEASPETKLILDHFGFTFLSSTTCTSEAREKSKQQMEQLLSLAKYDNVYIKISALFRIANPGGDPYPYERVKKERFDKLLEAFGKDRLMFGSDFPFVLNEDGSYKGAMDLVQKWTDDDEDIMNAVMYGTAERLFGVWGQE